MDFFNIKILVCSLKYTYNINIFFVAETWLFSALIKGAGPLSLIIKRLLLWSANIIA